MASMATLHDRGGIAAAPSVARLQLAQEQASLGARLQHVKSTIDNRLPAVVMEAKSRRVGPSRAAFLARQSALSVKQRNAVMVTRLREIRKGEGFHTPVAPAPPPGEPSQHPLKSARSLVKWRKDGSQLPSLQLRQERARAEARMHDENMRIAVMLCDCKPHYQRTRHVQLFSQHRKHLALACRSKAALPPLKPEGNNKPTPRPPEGRAPARRPGRPYSVPQPPGPPPSLLPPTARRQRRPTEFHIMSTVEAEEEDGEGGGGGEGEGGKEKEVPRAQAKADKDGKPDVRRGKLTVTVLNGKGLHGAGGTLVYRPYVRLSLVEQLCDEGGNVIGGGDAVNKSSVARVAGRDPVWGDPASSFVCPYKLLVGRPLVLMVEGFGAGRGDEGVRPFGMGGLDVSAIVGKHYATREVAADLFDEAGAEARGSILLRIHNGGPQQAVPAGSPHSTADTLTPDASSPRGKARGFPDSPRPTGAVSDEYAEDFDG